MKKALLTVCGVLVLGIFCFTNSASAAPIGHSNEGADYLVDSAGMGYWWLGAYVDSQKRTVLDGRVPYNLKKTEVMGYLGYSYVDAWLLYLSTGKQTISAANYISDSDWNYGLGTRLSLIDHIIPDPLLFEDRLRLNMVLQYNRSNVRTLYRNSSALEEYYASLLLSLVNDVDGNKLFLPNSIAIFAGPVWSDIKCSLFDEKNRLGYTYGLEVYYTERVSFDVRMQNFDDVTVMGGINVHL